MAETIAAVPLLDLERQYRSIRESVLQEVVRVCDSQQYVLGREVEALEQEVAHFVGTSFAVACASGTDALWLALAGAGVKPGSRVITTPFSFFASASSIVRTGAEPVFVDVDSQTLNLDTEKVRATIEREQRNQEKTPITAVLPVHLYGQCADMDGLLEIASEYKLALIEDAAQAIGARWKGTPAGSLGMAAAFSFYPTKNLSAYGDAGMVTTNSPEKAERMRRLRNHGSPERYLHTEFGWNARMDAIQAAVLRVKLKHIDQWNESRRKHAEEYTLLFQKAGLIDADPSGKSEAPIRLLYTSPHAFHIFHQYVVRAARRNELREFLKARGIGTEVYYPIPLHMQPVFSHLGYKEGDMPEAELAAKEVLALPMFAELTTEEIERVVAAIAEFYS